MSAAGPEDAPDDAGVAGPVGGSAGAGVERAMSSALGLRVLYATDLLAPARVLRVAATDTLTQTFTTAAPFPAGAFTLALWLRSDGAAGTVAEYSATGGSRLVLSAPGALQVTLDQSTVATGASVADGRWHQLALALARRGRTRYAHSLYLDGQLVHRAPGALVASAGGLLSAGVLKVGPLSADLSNVALWSAPLGPLEVLTSMNRRASAGTPGLVLNWPLDSPAGEGPNNLTNFVPSVPPLCFRTPSNPAGWVVATFTADGTSTYVVQVASADGLWFFEEGTTAASLPVEGVLLGRLYRARVGKRSGTTVAFDDPVELLPIDLAAPVLAISWPSSGLTAAWNPVDQAGAYAVGVLGAGAATVQSTTTSTLLDAHLADAGPAVLAVRAQLAAGAGASTSVGPANLAPALDAPAGAGFLFDPGFDGPNQQRLEVAWTPGATPDQFVYAQVLKQGGAAFYGHDAGSTGKLALALPGAGYAPGDTLACALRAVRPGALSTRATQNVQVADLDPAPSLHPLALDPTGHTATIAWDFDDRRFAGGVRYRVLVTLAGVEQAPIETTAKTATWSAPSGHDGQLVSIRVRAIALANIGRPSTSATFKVGTVLGAPTVSAACVNSTLTLTAAWSAVAGASGYRLTLRKPGDATFSKTLDVSAVTSADWPASATGLQAGTSYTLSVLAHATGIPDGPESAPFAFSSANLCPGTNPTPVGEPINQVTGQYLYAHLDLAVAGVVGLELVTYYSSPLTGASAGASVLGPYWTHSYEIRLTLTGGVATVALGDGSSERFTVPASLSGECPKVGPPNGDRLVAEVDGTYTLTRRDGRTLRFDAHGVLQSLTRRDGNALTFAYATAGGLLKTVTDAGSARALEFAYDSAGRLEKVSCGTLGVTFAHNAQTGDLTRVTNPAGAHRDFTYAAGSLLESAGDENGHTFVTNHYRSDWRIERQQTPRGTLTLSYEDGHDANGFATVTTTVVDAAGLSTKYYADLVSQQIGWEVAQLSSVTGSAVQAIGRVYDGLNRLVQSSVYEGSAPATIPPVPPLEANTTIFSYDGAGNLVGVSAPGGVSVAARYNADGTLASTTDVVGNTTTLTWAGGLLQRIDEPLGYRTELGYADAGAARNLVQRVSVYPGNAGVSGAQANVTSFEYSGSGDPQKITAPGGSWEKLDDDPLGRRTGRTVFAPDGTTLLAETYELEPMSGLCKTLRRRLGAQSEAQAYTERYGYDALGALHTRTDPLGNTTTCTYTQDNLLETVTYPPAPNEQPPQSTLHYDAYARLQKLTYATAPPVAYGYEHDPLGRLLKFTDANGHATSTAWTLLALAGGQRNLQRTTTYPQVSGASGPEQQRETLDPLGRVLTRTAVTLAAEQPGAPCTTYAYAVVAASGGNRYQIVATLPAPVAGGQGASETTLLDARGRPVQVTDARGKVWTFSYDTAAEGGVVCERARRCDPLGGVLVTLRDPLGRVVRTQALDSDGVTVLADTRVVCDALGRVNSVVEMGVNGVLLPASTCAYAYDATSTFVQTSVKPYGASGAAVHSFDGAGRWRGYRDPAGVAVALAYRPDGLLGAYINGRGASIAYGYDAAGRLTHVTPPAGDAPALTHVLDANGNRLETLLAGAGSIVRTFDERDRLRSRHETQSNETVAYDWWPGGLLKTLGYPGVATPVAYAYDRRGRLESVTDWLGAHTTYTWWETGQLKGAKLPGAIAAQWTFDDAGRLVDTLTAAPDGSVLAHAGFTLDGAGRPKAIDWLLPLAPDRPSAATTAMTYNGDRLQTVGGQAVGYDSDGNATALPGGPALAYDALNRLSTVAGTQFTYDADGLRRTFLLGGVALRATWSGGEHPDFYADLGDNARAVGGAQTASTPTGALLGLPLCGQPEQAQSLDGALPRLLALSDAAGAVQARHVYGVGLIETIGADGSVRVHVHDSSGSTLALADPAAAGAPPSDCYAYDPFGAPLLAAGTSQNPFRLHGQWGVTDAAGGPLAMGARDYAPGVLRFLQRDPLFGDPAAPQTLNRYAFAAGNPLQAIDPFGLASARAQDKNPGGGEGDALARGLVIGLGVATGLLLAAGAGAGLLGGGSLGAAGAGAAAGGVGVAAGGVEGAGALAAGEGTVAADAAAADVELAEFTAGRPSAGSSANEPLLDRNVVRTGPGWELRQRVGANVVRAQPPRAAPPRTQPTTTGSNFHED